MRLSVKGKRKNLTTRVALVGMFCALSIAVSFLESLIPPLVSIPGAKPGFSNIVTMFCVSSLGVPYALAVTLFKAFFALVTRGLTAFFMSLGGGLLSLLAMIVLFKFTKNFFGYIGIGIICALFHNIGQLAVAFIILGKGVTGLIPPLLLVATVCGFVTGTVFKYTLPQLTRITNPLFSTSSRSSKGVDK